MRIEVWKAFYNVLLSYTYFRNKCAKIPFSVYPYMFSPQQLHFMTDLIKSVKNVPGCFIEVGCYRGWTTHFFNRFMRVEQMVRPYLCIDTFAGFTVDDADYEYRNRGKPKGLYKTSFSLNDKKWFDYSMEDRGLTNIQSFQADASTFNYAQFAPIAFCLLDVDLYHPVKNALEAVYQNMSHNGVIVVDDCKQGGIWDGAYDAYLEFCRYRQLPVEIQQEKLGIIRKE